MNAPDSETPSRRPPRKFDPADMARRGRIGAHRLHATHDARETTASARAAARTALDRRLLAEIDPDAALPEVERARRLGHARKAHFQRLALKSAQARSARKARPTGSRATDLAT